MKRRKGGEKIEERMGRMITIDRQIDRYEQFEKEKKKERKNRRIL